MEMQDQGAARTGQLHPTGQFVLVTTSGIEEKPVLYIPEGAATRNGPARAIVMDMGADAEIDAPFTRGCVVHYINHVIDMGEDLKLVPLDHVVAWEDA